MLSHLAAKSVSSYVIFELRCFVSFLIVLMSCVIYDYILNTCQLTLGVLCASDSLTLENPNLSPDTVKSYSHTGLPGFI